jgi:4-amino-4-deoxy-L-arabinose transferase-like glycosyltransferase
VASGDGIIRTGEHGVARGFRRGLVMVLALAAAVRLAYIVGVHGDFALTGDAWVFHHEARFLANARGLVDPEAWRFDGQIRPTAAHPPLFVAFLTLTFVLGLQSPLGELVLNGLLGVVTVALVALLTRRLIGDRGGLIAGVIAALYPGMWAWNGQLLSETLATLLLVAVLMVVYRYLEDRSVRRAALLGATIGVAALTRSELIVLALLIPALLLAHFRAGRGVAQLVRHGAVALAMLVVVVAPWTAWNRTRFEHPVLLSTGLGPALAAGTCPEAMSGPGIGSYVPHCLDSQPGLRGPNAEPGLRGPNAEPGISADEQRELDESELDARYRGQALQIMSDNREHLPVVLAARVGRMFQVWAPLQQLRIDQLGESREWWVTGAAFATFYLVAAGAAVGALVLRRRRVRLYPLLLPVAVAAVGAVLAFGTARYRAPAEPCLVVLAAVGVDALVRRYEWRRARRAARRAAPSTAAPGRPPANRPAAAPGDEPARVGSLVGGGTAELTFDERRALWTDGRGHWTDGQGRWTDGHDVWTGDAPPGHPSGQPVGWAIPDPDPDPDPGVGWDDTGDAGWDDAGDGWDDEDGGGADGTDLAGTPRPVRLPVVVGLVMAVLVGVGAIGAWATVATGNNLSLDPVTIPAPTLPPAS